MRDVFARRFFVIYAVREGGNRLFRRPLTAFAACWIAGGASAASFGRAGVVLAGLALIAALTALVLVRKLGPRTAAACAAAYALAACHRAWTDAHNVTELADWAAAAEAGSPPAAVEAVLVIDSGIEIDGDRVSFRARVETIAPDGEPPRELRNERVQVRIRLAEEAEIQTAAGWRRGDRAIVAGKLERPGTAVNFGGFDYRAYLHRHRIHWLLTAESADSFRPLGRSGGMALFVQRNIDGLRQLLAGRMEMLFPREQSGYMNGLVLGAREHLDPVIYARFAELGLTHILAISGLHVGVFLLGIGSLLRLFKLPRETTLELTAAAVPFYVLLTGASPSVVRAGLMAMLGLAAARMNRLKDGMNLLAAAALAMLLYDPYYLSDIAFQLSFAVTAGLIALVPPLRRALPPLKRGRAVADLLVVTVTAQAVSFPLTIHYFSRFHLLSLPANALLVPFISFIVMPLGSAAMLLSLVWPEAGRLIARAAEAANDLTFAVVEQLAAWRPLATIWPSPPLWWILAWYGALLWFASRLPDRSAAGGMETESGQTAGDAQETGDAGEAGSGQGAGDDQQTVDVREAGSVRETGHNAGIHAGNDAGHSRAHAPRPLFRRLLLPAAAAALLLWHASDPGRFDRTAFVSFLDVGQGDAVLIRTPAGRHILVDGGGTLRFEKPGSEWRRRSDPFEVGKDVVAPLLMKRGVRHLDLIVATHLDTDHIGGLAAVLDAIPADALLWNGTRKDAEDAEALLRLADERGVKLIAAHRALEPYRPDADTEIRILWPDAGPVASSGRLTVHSDQNGRSVVLHVRLSGRTFLLTGDIGFPEERAIIALEPGEMMDDVEDAADVDVLKIAHHGSRYSTAAEWLAYWRPREAVISAGRYNPYGHPHPDTLNRIEDAAARIRRTDMDGETQYRIRDGVLSVRTALQDAAGR